MADECWRAQRVREFPQCFARQVQGVLDTRQGRSRIYRRIDPLASGIGHCNEVRRQIPAVHGRDIRGLQGAQVARIVPIVKMATEALQPLHRVQGRFQAVDGIARSHPTEVARADHAH